MGRSRKPLWTLCPPWVRIPPSPQVGSSSLGAKAAHYRQPQSFGDMVLTDRGLTTGIAQFALGDLTFKVHYPHYIYSSALVKVLWGHREGDFDFRRHLSQIFPYVIRILIISENERV